METKNLADIDLQNEYFRTLQASRVAGTVLLICCAAWCWMLYRQIGSMSEIFENMVTGGRKSMPSLTQFVLDDANLIQPITALAAFVAMGFIWAGARRISQVIYATIAGASVCVAAGALYKLAVNLPFLQIITKLQL
jgi:hypothetical protein